MPKIQLTSIFEEIAATVFQMKDLNEAKAFIIKFVETKNINEKDKELILKETKNAQTLKKLFQYLANAILKYEGMGMNQIRKTSKQAAHEDAIQFED